MNLGRKNKSYHGPTLLVGCSAFFLWVRLNVSVDVVVVMNASTAELRELCKQVLGWDDKKIVISRKIDLRNALEAESRKQQQRQKLSAEAAHDVDSCGEVADDGNGTEEQVSSVSPRDNIEPVALEMAQDAALNQEHDRQALMSPISGVSYPPTPPVSPIVYSQNTQNLMRPELLQETSEKIVRIEQQVKVLQVFETSGLDNVCLELGALSIARATAQLNRLKQLRNEQLQQLRVLIEKHEAYLLHIRDLENLGIAGIETGKAREVVEKLKAIAALYAGGGR